MKIINKPLEVDGWMDGTDGPTLCDGRSFDAELPLTIWGDRFSATNVDNSCRHRWTQSSNGIVDLTILHAVAHHDRSHGFRQTIQLRKSYVRKTFCEASHMLRSQLCTGADYFFQRSKLVFSECIERRHHFHDHRWHNHYTRDTVFFHCRQHSVCAVPTRCNYHLLRNK